MAEIDPQKVISRLATKLANKEVQLVVLESQYEAAQAELVEARRQIAELSEVCTTPKRSDS